MKKVLNSTENATRGRYVCVHRKDSFNCQTSTSIFQQSYMPKKKKLFHSIEMSVHRDTDTTIDFEIQQKVYVRFLNYLIKNVCARFVFEHEENLSLSLLFILSPTLFFHC